MFAGAQFSLYPITDGFVDVITSSLIVLDPWQDRLRIEADDISRQCQRNFLAGGFRAHGLVALTFRSLNSFWQPGGAVRQKLTSLIFPVTSIS
jgi:hypothetical protein